MEYIYIFQLKKYFLITVCVKKYICFITPFSNPECPPPSEDLAGHCILVDMVHMGVWHDMRAACQEQGGDMAKVHDPNFMTTLVDHIQCLGEFALDGWMHGVKV